MRRRSFFGALAGVLAVPAMMKAKPKTATIPDGETHYITLAPTTELPHKKPFVAEGKLWVMDGFVIINTSNTFSRTGDIIMTKGGDVLRVVDVFFSVTGDSSVLECKTLQSPKMICRRPVIQINRKWMQYKKSDRQYDIQFILSHRPYQEGGGSHG